MIAFSVRLSVDKANALTLTVSTNNGSASQDLPAAAQKYPASGYSSLFMNEMQLLPGQKQAVWGFGSNDNSGLSLSKAGIEKTIGA